MTNSDMVSLLPVVRVKVEPVKFIHPDGGVRTACVAVHVAGTVDRQLELERN